MTSWLYRHLPDALYRSWARSAPALRTCLDGIFWLAATAGLVAALYLLGG